MDTATLQVQTRDTNKSAKEYRAESLIPMELYGKGIDNQHLVCDYETFRKLFRTAGENTVIDLMIDGASKPVKVLVHSFDRDPMYSRYTHVDLKNIRMDEKITAMVKVHTEGEAPVVKEMGAIITQPTHEVEIKCLPGDLIHEILVDISSIVDLHSAIHVSDLEVPANVEILTAPEVTVVGASMPKEEVEEEAPAAEGEEGAAEGEGEEAAAEEKSAE